MQCRVRKLLATCISSNCFLVQETNRLDSNVDLSGVRKFKGNIQLLLNICIRA